MQPTVTPPQSIRVLAFKSPFHRWLLLVPVVAVLLGCIYTIRWCAGNTIARTAANRELAEFVVRLAPADPQTHYALGKAAESSLLPTDQELAVREYETAVRLARDDYRLWMLLAVARERLGDIAGAETAYLRAENLAPAYSMPKWSAGNFMLRQGRSEDSMPRLMAAGESMERLRRPVLELAIGYYGVDIQAIIGHVGRRPELSRGLLQLLLDRNELPGATEVWDRLEPNERAAAAPLGNRLVSALVAAKYFVIARHVQNKIPPGSNTESNEIENRSFEGDVATEGVNIFGWRLGAGGQPQIALDSGQSRGRSLLLSFNVTDRAPLKDVTQLIVVRPRQRFRLTYFVRSAAITGAATARVQVLNAVDQQVLAQSDPVPLGSSEWRSEALDFSVPDSTSAIILRLGVATCAAEFCPVFGRVWYDDFELKQIDGPVTLQH